MTEMDGIIREHEAAVQPLFDRCSSLLRSPEVYFATLAEQAERYDEMAEHMRAVGRPRRVKIPKTGLRSL